MRVVGSLFVVALLVLLVGLALDWWSFTSEVDAGGDRTRIAFDVDKDEIRRDADRARQKVSDIGDSIRGDDDDPAAVDEDFVAVVAAVQTSPPVLELEVADGEPLRLDVAPDAVVVIDGSAAELEDLRVGDRVSLVRDEDLVRSIRVDR